MNLALWLESTARVNGAAPALHKGMELVADYSDFRTRAAALGRALGGRGVAPGDRVALFMKNCPDYLVALYGIWYAGAAAVPINAKLHPKEAAWIIDNSGARIVFVTPDLGPALGAVTDISLIDVAGGGFADMIGGDGEPPVSRDQHDLAWLFYTSGTTGRPKGACITHGMLMATSLCYPVDVDPVQPEDAAYYAAPMSHGAGLYAPIHVRMGARHICPASGGFDAAELLETAAQQGPLSMFMAPTMVRRLVDAARTSGSAGDGIKTIVYGGGPMYRADIEEAVSLLGDRFVQIYGQGECPMAITALSRSEVSDRVNPRWRERLASVGRAQSAVEVRIGDNVGRHLPTGEIGEIMVRGAPVMAGYWQNAEANAKTVRDGWLMTGDVGSLDADGYLTLQDRTKDVIISGGTNIYPREIEEVLLTHPAVRECSVVGRPSPEWGEEVIAFVVLAEAGATVSGELDALCLNEIARFKRPKEYRFIAELPKNNYGKVLKTALREMLQAEARG
ncbi:class I adenylate-forming enzyme family protein [Pseudorhizobium flavum]|jgi:long-chain acyl-CoA synthetase|uniref:3-methylmercaptopropionyl-CoA ligase n=1 Tax=Pseudorhizobium flavum TaxID=1335061 RepID=A0A7W9Z229_9HYPH|nr:AMP-binding protein [Pseudorhizobium flavum]MBB6182634.1 long-chain acyl-CoA synthetase [Pseudorhizobium flavum]CAD6631299.1 AMP-dependent synthetase [Pseudorhizobium flavum]